MNTTTPERDFIAETVEKLAHCVTELRGRIEVIEREVLNKKTSDSSSPQKVIAPQYALGVNCPDCDAPMVERNSYRGKFYGCSTYPECRGTRPIRAGVILSPQKPTSNRALSEPPDDDEPRNDLSEDNAPY